MPEREGAPAAPRGRSGRVLWGVALFFAGVAAADVYSVVTRPNARAAANLIVHLCMAAAVAAPLWAGRAPAGSPRRRAGTAVSASAMVGMLAAAAWRLSLR